MTSAPHPEIWAFGQLLEAIGLDGSPAMALGLAGGAGFIGMGFRYDEHDFSSLHVSGWNPFQGDLPGAAKRLGLIGSLDETSRKRRAAKSFASALDSGGPVAVWLDTATVGLAPEALLGSSPGVVIARRGAGDVIELADGTATVQASAERIAEARSIHAAQRYRTLSLKAPREQDRAAAARAGLARLAVGATGGEPSDQGPEGVRQLADSIGGEGDGTWREVFEGDRHLLGALTNLYGAVTREQGLLRAPQAAFERDAAELLALPGLVRAADAHAALSEGWLAVAERALPADVPGFAAARKAGAALDLPQDVAAEPFPLSVAEQDELLAELGAAVGELATVEHETLELLRETLRAA